MTSGLYAETNFNAPVQSAPVVGRTGGGCLFVQNQSGGFNGTRLVLPSTYLRLLVHQACYSPQIPSNNNTMRLLEWRDNTNALVGSVFLQSDGSIDFQNSTGTSVARTSANVFVPGAWNQLQIDYTINAATGAVKLLVNTVQQLNVTNVNTGATAIGMIRWYCAGAAGDTNPGYYLDDLVINTATGTYNSTLLGDVHVATQYVVGNGPVQGWTQQPRFKFGNGILGVGSFANSGQANPDAVFCTNTSDFQLGSGDFTIEGFWRFLNTPSSANYYAMCGQWREDSNERCYQLLLGGSAFNGGKLAFRISTDGTAGTVATIASIAWTPVFGHWHHIVIQRASGKTTLFIDGVAQNAPVTDANTYFTPSTAGFFIGAQQNTAIPATAANTGFVGFQEEFRLTKGVGRYGAGYVVPTSAYPRSGGGDPNFASVSLLAGWDSALLDESSHGRSITALQFAARFAVDDSGGAYQTIDNSPPRDDTYVEAPFTAASGVLTFTANAANNDTVTVDGNTYTFKSPFVNAAGNVAIGAAATNSIDNLVAAINGGAGSGTLYGAGTTPSANTTASNNGNNQLIDTANVQGTAGNAIGTTSSSSNFSWTNTTLTGGVNIPGPSSFLIGRLPPGVTGVFALTMLKRARKSDAGAGTMDIDFVSAGGSATNGASTALTTNFVWYTDILEQDPATSAQITPTSFIGAALRLNRTA